MMKYRTIGERPAASSLTELMSDTNADAENHLRTIFRRCVQCPPEAPSCPACASDETCSLRAQSCDACASTTCVKIGSLPGQATPQSSTPMGTVVGGVVGGVAVIVIAMFLVWQFWFKPRRRQMKEKVWVDQPVEKRDPSTLHRGDRRSTRTVASIASTVRTHASNVIQIAYIPGVTNRSPPDSPGVIPPVPALPFGPTANSAPSSPCVEQDTFFFKPGDLRDSTFSDASSVADQRISLTPSLARASVATTIYRNNAIVSPVPAQQVFRTKPAVVSVRSGTSTPGSQISQPSGAPPMPQLPKAFANGTKVVARDVSAKTVEIKKPGSNLRVPTTANLAQVASANTSNATSKASSMSDKENLPQATYSDEKEVLVLSPTTVIEDSPVIPNIQFKPSFQSLNTVSSSSDTGMSGTAAHREGTPSGATSRVRSTAGLSTMIEDALSMATRDPAHHGLGSRPELHTQDLGPFSDANEL